MFYFVSLCCVFTVQHLKITLFNVSQLWMERKINLRSAIDMLIKPFTKQWSIGIYHSKKIFDFFHKTRFCIFILLKSVEKQNNWWWYCSRIMSTIIWWNAKDSSWKATKIHLQICGLAHLTGAIIFIRLILRGAKIKTKKPNRNQIENKCANRKCRKKII